MIGRCVLIAAVLGGLAACAGTGDPPGTGEVQEELPTCRSPKPTPGPCQNVTCVSGSWVFSNKTPGTPCGSGGTCNSSGVCVNPTPPPPPTVPTNVHVPDRHPTSITVAWNASASTTQYQVVMNGIIQGNTTATTITISNLNQSSQYCFTITAIGPGGATAAAPVCAYTGFYVPINFIGSVLDSVPWEGQTPRMDARVERVELWAGQDLGVGGGFTLVRPGGHQSDCTSGDPDKAIFLSPGQAPLPFQLANIFGEGNPPLDQFGFDFGFDGLWLDGCASSNVSVLSTIWMEVNFTLASTIHVVSATYGANVGASGNMTDVVGQLCNNRVFCADQVANFGNVQDPAPGQAKDFVASWTCGSDPTLRTTSVPAEALFATTVLECP